MGCGAIPGSRSKDYVTDDDVRSISSESPKFKPGQKAFLVCYETKRKITDVYESCVLDDDDTGASGKLATGKFGAVRRVMNVDTGYVRVAKTCQKKKMSKEQVKRFHEEVRIMNMLDFPGILKLYAVFEDPHDFYVILDYCEGGPVIAAKATSSTFGELQTAPLLRQVLQAVRYLHFNCICHRDLRPANLLLGEIAPVEVSPIKVVDFNSACTFKYGRAMTSKVGQPEYIAPQVFMKNYDQSCDVWGCGACMLFFLSGRPPFEDGILKSDVTPIGGWGFASADARSLLTSLLAHKQEERPSAMDALEHAWLAHLAPRALGVPISAAQLRKMVAFCEQSELKKMVMHIIARRLPDEEVHEHKEQFMSLDRKCDGVLTYSELKAALMKTHKEQDLPDVKDLLGRLDLHGNRSINYTEFVAANMDVKWLQDDGLCWAAFRHFDKDASGQISLKNLKRCVSGYIDREHRGELSEKILQDLDCTGNNMIDFGEFLQALRGGSKDELIADRERLEEDAKAQYEAHRRSVGRIQPDSSWRLAPQLVEKPERAGATLEEARRMSAPTPFSPDKVEQMQPRRST